MIFGYLSYYKTKSKSLEKAKDILYDLKEPLGEEYIYRPAATKEWDSI